MSTYNERLKIRATETVPVKVTSASDDTVSLDLQTPVNRDTPHVPVEAAGIETLCDLMADIREQIKITNILLEGLNQ